MMGLGVALIVMAAFAAIVAASSRGAPLHPECPRGWPVLRAEDVEAAAAFWREAVGFAVSRDSDGNVVLEKGGFRILLEPGASERLILVTPDGLLNDAIDPDAAVRRGGRTWRREAGEMYDDPVLLLEDPFGNRLAFVLVRMWPAAPLDLWSWETHDGPA